jgi:hypothetical protein
LVQVCGGNAGDLRTCASLATAFGSWDAGADMRAGAELQDRTARCALTNVALQAGTPCSTLRGSTWPPR